MAFDAHANLAISTVATAPSPASSGTTLTVATGEGARFPAAPFNCTVWPSPAVPTPANAEIIRVTSKGTGDNWTIVRAQESSSARTIVVGDLIAATITKKTIDDIEAGTNFGTITASGTITGNHVTAVAGVLTGTNLNVTTATVTGQVVISGAGAGQIVFPATQNASANANTFDDYEEGTWTPNLGGSTTYTAQSGTYTKKGREVFIAGHLIINAIGTGQTGTVNGLPFAPAALTAGTVGFFAVAAGNFVFVSCYADGSQVFITGLTAAGPSCSPNPAVFFGDTTDIYFAATYVV